MAKLSPMAKTVLRYYVEIFPSSAGPLAVARKLGLNGNSVRGLVQALAKQELLEHVEREYRAAKEIVDTSQPRQEARSRGQAENGENSGSTVSKAGMPEKAEETNPVPVDPQRASHNPGYTTDAKKLDWAILVRFCHEDRAAIEDAARKSGFRAISAFIRSAGLEASHRQHGNSSGTEDSISPALDEERLASKIAETVRSAMKDELHELSDRFEKIPGLDFSEVQRKALFIILEHSKEVTRCRSEDELLDLISGKDQVLGTQLQVEIDESTAFENVLRTLHENRIITWNPSHRTIRWNANRLKPARKEVKLGLWKSL